MRDPSPISERDAWRIRLPFFYGWVVLGSLFLTQAILFGIYYSFSVFFVALLEEFDWSRAATAGVFSLFVMVKALGGVPAGALVDRFGPSRVVPVGALVVAAGMAASSAVSELWQFYVTFGVVVALGLALASWVPCVAVVSRWFSRRLGTAIGIAGAGIGLGIVVVVPLSQLLISAYGWRAAYLILGAVALVGVVPQSVLLLVGRPEELGLRPDGVARGAISSGTPTTRPSRRIVVVDQKWATYPWTALEAMATSRFWLLAASFVLSNTAYQMLWLHQVAFLVDGGYEKMLAASVSGLAGFVSIFAKILWGAAGDRLGRERAFTMGIATLMLGILLLVLTRVFPALWLVLLFAVVFSVGYSVGAAVSPASAADIFAGKRFGAIYGTVAIGSGIGSSLGAWAGGYVFDVTGSYLIAFAGAALSALVSIGCLWLAAPRRVRRVERGGTG